MIRGVENMMMDLCLEEENRVFEFLDYCYEATSQFIKMMAEAGADMVSNGDSPAGPSMLSPDMYERFALPYEKKVCEYAHQLGVPYLLHICGNTDIIIDQMITCGTDVLELDYKTNINRAEEKMRGKTVLQVILILPEYWHLEHQHWSEKNNRINRSIQEQSPIYTECRLCHSFYNSSRKSVLHDSYSTRIK